jgi:hypothetical protein
VRLKQGQELRPGPGRMTDRPESDRFQDLLPAGRGSADRANQNRRG